MWNRKELKENGKTAFKSNYWICVVAGLLLSIATGNGLSVSAGNINFPQKTSDEMSRSEITEAMSNLSAEDLIVMGSIVLTFVLISLAIALIITAFLLVPLEVGARKFFIDNTKNENLGITRDNLGMGFEKHYKSIVKSVFSTKLLEMLWSLLLIVPGIYKSYCWRFVPYIISQNPTMTGKEARELSNKLMTGNKWDAFIFDLSFIGWYLLGIITIGILNIFWVNPYKAASDAELYRALSEKAYTV